MRFPLCLWAFRANIVLVNPCHPVDKTHCHLAGLTSEQSMFSVRLQVNGAYARSARVLGPTLDITTASSAVLSMPSIPAIETPLTAQELSKIVPLHPVTILRWAREGRIPCRRLSARKVLFLPSEVSRWLSSGSSLYTEPAGRRAA